MNKWLNNLNAKIQRWLNALEYRTQQWMLGRYGVDEFSRALYFISLALLIAGLFPRVKFLSIPALFLMIWSCVRCYSRKIEKRQQERETYLRVTGNVKAWFRLQKNRWRDRKKYRYFRCKECKAVLRVPRGKGRIRIHCPKCHNEIDAKT